jgi:cytochrome c biogenesis protein CcdA
MGNYVFSFLAGVLSLLSPCVLPIVPIVLSTAVSRHRLGPVALSVGLAVSFTAIGIIIAVAGFSLGINADHIRSAAASIMVLAGLALFVERLQDLLTRLISPITQKLGDYFEPKNPSGLLGQFTVGLLLGAVWSPCVGPTLGAASVLAAQGKQLGHVAFTMLLFGIGAATPLLLLGFITQETFRKWRGSLMQASSFGKKALGLSLVAIGALIGSGFDRQVEAFLVGHSPDWLIFLSTRF